MFFLLTSSFRLGTLLSRPFLPSLFLVVESWTLTFTEASEVFSSLDDVVGSFLTSWMNHCCTLGVILFGRPLVGRFTTVPCFVDYGSHCGLLESQSFRNCFITFSSLRDPSYFLSPLLLNFFGLFLEIKTFILKTAFCIYWCLKFVWPET